jgi:hypothetical protein
MRFTTAKTHKTSPIDSDRNFFEGIHPYHGVAHHRAGAPASTARWVQTESNLSRLIRETTSSRSHGPHGAARRCGACSHARVPRAINSVSGARQPAAALFGYRRTAGTQALFQESRRVRHLFRRPCRMNAREKGEQGGPQESRTTCSTLCAWPRCDDFVVCVRYAAIGGITRACPNGRNEAVISTARSDTSTVR